MLFSLFLSYPIKTLLQSQKFLFIIYTFHSSKQELNHLDIHRIDR